jgi:hypothetical protein
MREVGTRPDARGNDFGGAARILNMLALPALVLTPITPLHQRAATSPRTLNRWVTTMFQSTPIQDSGSANTTASETTSARRSRNGGRGRGNGQGGSAEDGMDGMEARRGGWKGRDGRGRGGARPADARERPTHCTLVPLHMPCYTDEISSFPSLGTFSRPEEAHTHRTSR